MGHLDFTEMLSDTKSDLASIFSNAATGILFILLMSLGFWILWKVMKKIYKAVGLIS